MVIFLGGESEQTIRRRKEYEDQQVLWHCFTIGCRLGYQQLGHGRRGSVQGFKDYGVAVVQEFGVSPTTPAPDNAGSQIAEEIVFQLRRYSEKLNLEMVVKGCTKAIPPGEKMLLIKGEVKEYTKTSHGKQILRGLSRGYTTATASATHYQFIDKKAARSCVKPILEQTGHINEDTVEYAMETNAEAAAKVVAKLKGK